MSQLGDLGAVLVNHQDIEIREMVGLSLIGVDEMRPSDDHGPGGNLAVVLYPASCMHGAWDVKIVP